MGSVIGIEDQSGTTEWSQLKKLCAGHDATLHLRAETMGENDFRFSLAAKNKQGKLVHDNRMDAGDHAPQFVVTSLVNRALEEWWQ